MTTTDAGGGFKFNPFAIDSAEIDPARYIPAGPIALWVTGEEGATVARREHTYDETCPIAFNGSNQSLPCKTHVIELEPMSLPEFVDETVAFYEEDCGFRASTAAALGAAAVGGDPTGQATFGLTDPGGTELSCIFECTTACAGQPMVDFIPCACICVEGDCNVPFGPFCAESSTH